MIIMKNGKPLNKCPKCGVEYEIKPGVVTKRKCYTADGEMVEVTFSTCQNCHETERVQYDNRRSIVALEGLMRIMPIVARGTAKDSFLKKKYKRENAKLDNLRKQNEQRYKNMNLYDEDGVIIDQVVSGQ